MEGIKRKARLNLNVGMLSRDLVNLHNKAPEAHEEIVKLTKDLVKLIYCYVEAVDGEPYDSEKANKLAEVIISKF